MSHITPVWLHCIQCTSALWTGASFDGRLHLSLLVQCLPTERCALCRPQNMKWLFQACPTYGCHVFEIVLRGVQYLFPQSKHRSMTRSAVKGSSGVSILQLERIKPLPTGVFWGSFKAFISSTVKSGIRNSFTIISSIDTKCRRKTIINNDLKLYLLCRNMNARMRCSQHTLTASKCHSRNKCRHQCLQSPENDIRFSLSISTSALLATIWFAFRIHSRCSALLRVSNTWK